MRIYRDVLSLLVVGIYISTCVADKSTTAAPAENKVTIEAAATDTCTVPPNPSDEDVRRFIAEGCVEKYKGDDQCRDNECDHNCVDMLFNHTCVCDRGYALQADKKTCTDTRPWRDFYTALCILGGVLLMSILLCCCCWLCFKHLKHNLLCKTFMSWTCCITGCFCKVKDGKAIDKTTLNHHDVKIIVSDHNTEEEEQELNGVKV